MTPLGIPYENTTREKKDTSSISISTASSFDVENIISALALASAITASAEYLGGKFGVPVLPIST